MSLCDLAVPAPGRTDLRRHGVVNREPADRPSIGPAAPQILSGPRMTYVAPQDVRAAPPSYPGARVARMLDNQDPGAELYAAIISIEHEVPRHFHPVFELQYVLAGTGLAIDADGRQMPIGPGGAVLAPAGTGGSHGFRNTGSLPLTLLCVFPAEGGRPPDRTMLSPGSILSGPRMTYVAPQDVRAAPPSYPGARVARMLDNQDPGAELYAAIISIEHEVPRHFHPVFELQYVLAGTGLAIDADGRQMPIGPGGAVLAPAGTGGSHGFRNTGSLPLTLLCVFPAEGGRPPDRTMLS